MKIPQEMSLLTSHLKLIQVEERAVGGNKSNTFNDFLKNVEWET